jgi:hypothetical protein
LFSTLGRSVSLTGTESGATGESSSSNLTTVPGRVMLARSTAFQLVRRMQPCDSVLPMAAGEGVPWMPYDGGSEVDPDEAYRVVRSRGDDELAFGLHPFPGESRIVNIVGVPVDLPYLEHPVRCWLFLAANRGRIEGKQVSVLVVGAHVARRLVHHDCRRNRTIFAVGRNHFDRMAPGASFISGTLATMICVPARLKSARGLRLCKRS